MSIDWGIALGAAVKSGVNTYTTLQDQAAKDLQMQRVKRQMDDEDGFRRAQSEAAREQYTGGEAVSGVVDRGLNFTEDQKAQLKADFAKMPVDQQQTALRAYANAGYANEGQDLSKIGVYRGANGEILATNQVKEYTPVQRQGMVLDRMMKEGNLYGVEKSLQLKQMLRENELKDRFDKFTSRFQDEMAEVQGVIQGKGLSGVPEAVNGKLKAHGMQAEYVPSKSGGMVVVKQGKNVVGQYTNPDDVMTGIANAQLSLFSQELLPLFGDIGQVTQWLGSQYQLRQKDKELALKGQEIAIKGQEAASAAGYRQGMLAHQNENLKWNQHKFGIEFDQKERELAARLGNANSTASPLLGTVDGAPVYKNPAGPGAVFGDGAAVPPTAAIKKEAPPNPMQQQVDAYASMLLGTGEINKATGKPYTPAEAQQAGFMAYRGKDDSAAHRTTVTKLIEMGLKPGTPDFNAAYNTLMRPEGGSLMTATERALRGGQEGKPGVLDSVFGPKKSETAPAAPKAALPQSAIPVDKELPATERLKQAAAADAKAGGTYHFTQLATEARDKVSLIQEQLKNLDVSIPKMPAEARKPLEERKKQLKADLKVYKSILDQQKARTGLN